MKYFDVELLNEAKEFIDSLSIDTHKKIYYCIALATRRYLKSFQALRFGNSGFFTDEQNTVCLPFGTIAGIRL